jgi:hypothetical protein
MARFTLPTLVFEIAPGFVAGARLEGSGHQARRVRRMGVQQLEPHSLEPHPGRPNVANQEEVRRAIREVAAVTGNGTGRFGLVVPDGAVRVAVLLFETLPEDAREAEALVRWRMRDKLPFAPEEARVSYQVLWRAPGHVEVLAAAARSSVLSEYEAALEPINGGPALTLPATLALLPLLPDRAAGGHLLLHVCSRWVTAVLMVKARPCFWRTRELDTAVAEDPAKAVASEAARVLASARDHLETKLEQAWLCVRPPTTSELVSAVADAISHEVELLTPRPGLDAALSSGERRLFEYFGAPVAGLVSNPW